MAESRPIYNDQGDVVDFQVITHRQGNADLIQQDYIEQPNGTFKHIYQDVHLESDRQDTGNWFAMGEYQQALVESMPDLPAAIKWVEHSPDFTAEELQAYNAAFDSQDLKTMNEFYERLMPLYRQAVAEQQHPQQSPDLTDDDGEFKSDNVDVEEWFDELSDDFIDSTVNSLYETEFDADSVEIMDSLATQYEPGGAHFEILQVGQQIANGSLTVDDAIDQITSEFGEAMAAAAYIELQHMIANYYG